MNPSWRALLGELCSWNRRSAFIALGLAAAAAAALVFVGTTGLAWEDFFITYRFSENLARGHGLVYNLGERVQGFTSPINTLLPALFAFLFRAKDYVLPLDAYRAVALIGLLFGFACAGGLLTRERPTGSAAFVLGACFPLLAALEIKTTAFSMSGQETAFVIGFFAAAFALAARGWTRHAVLGGVLCAGLMYSRPDGFVEIGAVALAALAFEPGPRRALLFAWLRSAAICAALYLPWFVFAWIYFGSPIPHTIIAKHGLASYQSPAYGAMAIVAAGFAHAPSVLCRGLAPIYDWLNAGHGIWPKWMHDACLALELFAVTYWLLPTRDRLGRMASLVSALLALYLIYVDLAGQFSPWYYPPLAFLSLFTLASAASSLCRRPAGAVAGGALFLGAAGLVGFIFVHSLFPLRMKQRIIENDQRRAIGLWLKDHAQPGDTVYLEPLGYIGYFSQCHMLDWPGLVAPSVVDLRRRLVPGKADPYVWAPVAEALRPTWILTRPVETDMLNASPYLSSHYALAKVFNVRPEIWALGDKKEAPGMNITYTESLFNLYHAVTPGRAPAPSPP